MNICLVTSPRYNCKPVQEIQEAIGLGFLAAVARRAGHVVTGVDGVVLGYPKTIAQRVAAAEPDVIGTSTTTTDRMASIAAIRQIRLAVPKAFIVVGGSHYSHSAEDALESVPEIDAVVIGEGENTFLDLLNHLPGRDGLAEVQGLVWRDRDGQIVRNDPRPLMTDLNSLPMPAWDLFLSSRHHFHSRGVGKLAAVKEESGIAAGVMTTRGCPQSCVFCANSLNKKMRYLDPALAVDQMEFLHKTYGVTALNLYDDDFLVNSKHAVALCEEMLRRNCKFTWWCGARASRLDIEVLRLLKRAGCRSLSFGVETGTNEVLKAIRKNVTTDQIYEAMEIVGKVEMDRVELFLILGLPGETPDTIDRTLRFLTSLKPLLGKAWRPKTLLGQLPHIYPGTEMVPLGHENGCLPENFSWNRPYLDPNRHLPLVNHRYRTVPHFQNRNLPISELCDLVRRKYWNEVLPGRRRRFFLTPFRKLKSLAEDLIGKPL